MATIAEKFETKSLGKPDEVRTFEKGKVELVTVCGRIVGKATFEPGWKWSTCVKPIAQTAYCESAHFGYQLKGTMRIKTAAGEEYVIKEGDVFDIPPGHDGWVEGNEPVVAVDFQGMVDYAKKR